jgi:hypothetical protein
VEPGYLLDEMFVSFMLGPHSLTGGVGGIPPQKKCHQGGLRGRGGGATIFVAPLEGDSGTSPTKKNFGKNFLIKYHNFIVNLDHSL